MSGYALDCRVFDVECDIKKKELYIKNMTASLSNMLRQAESHPTHLIKSTEFDIKRAELELQLLELALESMLYNKTVC